MGTDSQRVVVRTAIHPRVLDGPWVPTLACPPAEARAGSKFKEAVRRGDQVYQGRLCCPPKCVVFRIHTRTLCMQETCLNFADLMNQWFAPTKLSITFETEGQGKFTEEEIHNIVERDVSGKVIALYLPSKCVTISNHQVRVHIFLTCRSADPVVVPGLLRLVVRLVLDLLRAHAQGRLHCPKEESQMDPRHWAGMNCLWLS